MKKNTKPNKSNKNEKKNINVTAYLFSLCQSSCNVGWWWGIMYPINRLGLSQVDFTDSWIGLVNSAIISPQFQDKPMGDIK